jgi:hypothetical protein
VNILRLTHEVPELDTVHIWDDFFWFVTAHQWTSLVADSTPTVAVGDAVNGVVALFTDTTDNNEVAIRSTAELFKVGTNREIYGRCKLQYAENDTNKANVFFGFGSAIGADFLVNNGAGPRVTGDILGIFKVDGGTVWKCVSQVNGTATVTESTTTAGGTTAQVLEVIAKDWDGVKMEVLFKVGTVAGGSEFLKDSNGNVIRHTVAIASATEMNIGVYVKTGGGAGGETVNVDYIYGAQNRI